VHPDSNLRDNAEYWLAEISYAQQDFEGALAGFQKVISMYPASRKIPDAWLKVGYCQYELNRWAESRQALNIVVTQFPETTAARLARERLEEIRKAGR
jgi:tol-pal system protein YbgF